MLKATVEIASCLLFPKVCETCENLLPARDSSGVCKPCSAKIIKIAPPFCAGCGRTAVYENVRCSHCAGDSFHFDRAYAVSLYEGKMRELLQAYKFSGRKSLKHFFTGLMEEFISKYIASENFDAVLSVPMAAQKENERGFNQASLLSSEIARKTGKKELSGYFKRKKSRLTQSRLTKIQRAQNIEGSFFVTRPEVFAGKKILLLDDILTTGFTASECAKTLKHAGAASVTVLTVARGL